MKNTTLNINSHDLKVYTLNTVVVGSGAAGFNAADRLYQYGQRDVAIISEHINAGTSRNTGSDKQTYYKLTLSGGEPDSVREMAQTLFDGQCVDGDTALAEAALSAQSFLRLVEAGVPFPRNRYGEYVGYKTDHDPRCRATSVGPYTSRQMTECLEKQVREKDIAILDKRLVIRILSDGSRIYGLLCLNLDGGSSNSQYEIFCCHNIVWATGGPAGMYANSVYPHGHYGSTGLALEAGALGQNLTEWQYGLASVKPRWNVSGTYMQVLPRFVSTDMNGGDEREFLLDFFDDIFDMLGKVFLKGYQWPFDVRKIENGSSIIDILVYIQQMNGRRVFLDFRTNPLNKDIDFNLLPSEAQNYLRQAEACFGKPYQRLCHMNRPAVDFYRDKNVDLETEMLEISLCAQHNNGGIAVDCWWQSHVRGLSCIGECAGTHGVYRPGGSALNAGQVGGLRCAQCITAARAGDPVPYEQWHEDIKEQVLSMIQLGEQALVGGELPESRQIYNAAALRMSNYGAAIRSREQIRDIRIAAQRDLDSLNNSKISCGKDDLVWVYRLRDMLISQIVYLGAMEDYLVAEGKSRGSALYTDMTGKKPYSELPDTFTFRLDDESKREMVQVAEWNGGKPIYSWRKVRPISAADDFFENVWREFRKISQDILAFKR